MLDRRDHCTFITSLIWLLFGKRSADDVTFKLAPVYERKGIRSAHTAAEGFDLERQVVVTADEEVPYDRLVVSLVLARRSRRSRVSGPNTATPNRSAISTMPRMPAKPGSDFSRTRGRELSVLPRAIGVFGATVQVPHPPPATTQKAFLATRKRGLTVV